MFLLSNTYSYPALWEYIFLRHCFKEWILSKNHFGMTLWQIESAHVQTLVCRDQIRRLTLDTLTITSHQQDTTFIPQANPNGQTPLPPTPLWYLFPLKIFLAHAVLRKQNVWKLSSFKPTIGNANPLWYFSSRSSLEIFTTFLWESLRAFTLDRNPPFTRIL